MKIVIFDREEAQKIGGIYVYNSRLVKHLEKRGHTVSVLRFTNKKVKEKQVFPIPYYLAEERSIILLPSESSLSIIKEYLAKIQPDIVYLPIGLSTLDFFLPNLCHELKIPLAGVWHADINSSFNAFKLMMQSIFLLYLPFCKQIDMLHVFSNNLAKFYSEKGMEKNKILVLPNGIDSSVYVKNQKSGFATKNKIKKGILFIGRLTLQKNPEILINSFLALNPPEDTKLILVGYGDQEADLKKKYQDKRIIFTGVVLDEAKKIEIMSACQIFVLPSRVEGVSLALLEAMSCGMACIATDAGSNAKVLDKAGVVIPVSKIAKQLPVVLKTYLDNPLLVKEAGMKARDRVIKYSSQEKNFDKLISFFLKTINNYQKERSDSQTNLFNLDQEMLETIKNLWKKIKEF